MSINVNRRKRSEGSIEDFQLGWETVPPSEMPNGILEAILEDYSTERQWVWQIIWGEGIKNVIHIGKFKEDAELADRALEALKLLSNLKSFLDPPPPPAG